MKSLVNQIHNDYKNVQHDIFLIYLIPIPIFLALIFPFIFNQIAIFFEDFLNIRPYYPLFSTYIFLVLPAMLWGTIYGFLIINEKDLHTLKAIQVTPFGIRRLVYYRIFFGIIISWITQLVSFIILNFNITIELIYLISLSSVFSPIIMLVISTIAKNKVQAFAIMKASSSFFVFPFFFLLIPKFEIIFVVIPTYWIFKPLIDDYFIMETEWYFYLAAAVSQFIWLIFWQKMFQKRIT